MPEGNSKAKIIVIKALSIMLAFYVCVVVVAVVVIAFSEGIPVTTVIHNWYNGLIDFVKGMFV